MKTKLLSTLLVGFLCSVTVSNVVAAWIDWTSTSAGTLTVGSTTIGVSMTGGVLNYVNGDYYYNNSATGGISPTGTYGGLQPSDLIQINSPVTVTLMFDEAIINPYIALVSVGQKAIPVTYGFDSSFSVATFGNNLWGYGGYSVSGNDFTGTEFNGVLQFTGSYTSLSFTTSPAEFWHGFNIGTASIAAVPEPSILWLLSAGLLSLVIVRKKQS